MPWTNPISTLPDKQWLYLDNTTSVLGNAANEDSLICWAYAQGFTGIILYQLSTLSGGNTSFSPTIETQLAAFITKCSANGLEVGGTFEDENTLQAVINYNTTYTAGNQRFTRLISNIEWWNYSYNLPYKDPSTGTYSFYDTLKMFMTYKPIAGSVGVSSMVAYSKFTNGIDYDYNYKYPVVAEYKNNITQGPDPVTGLQGFAISGNFTSNPATTIIEDNVFQNDQVIKVNNYPSAGLSSYLTLASSNPVSLTAGKTVFNVVNNEVSDGRIFSGDYRVSVQVSSYSVVASQYIFNVPIGHGITSNTRLVTDYSAHPELNFGSGSPTSNIDISSVTPTTLTTYTNVPEANIISYEASAGTVKIDLTVGNAVKFLINDIVTITGLPGAFSGSYVITNKGSNYIEYSALVPNTVSTVPPAGKVKIVSRSLVTFPSPVTFYASFVSITNNTSVANLFEVVYLGPGRIVDPSFPYEIALRGDKSYYLTDIKRVSKIQLQNFNLPAGADLFTIGSWTYNSATNQTRILVAEDPYAAVGAGPEYTTFGALANLDVVYESNSSYGNPGTELQQLMPHVDGHALTVYDQNVPNYSYVRSRVLELGQGAAAMGGYTPNVYYLFGAYNAASLNFYRGLDAIGTNYGSNWPKKGIREAYDYMSFTLSPSTTTKNIPSQTGSPISAEAETDADILANVKIDGAIAFRYSDLKNQNIKNGPNVLIGPTDPTARTFSVVGSTTGTLTLPLTFCDDCLPKSSVIKRETDAFGVSTLTLDGMQSFTANASVVISGVGAGYDGTYTIFPVTGNKINYTSGLPVETVTSCSGTVTIPTTITWNVTNPGGASSSFGTTTTSLATCNNSPSASYSTTFNYNGAGTYYITATVNNPYANPSANPYNTNTDKRVTDVLEYTVTVNSTAPPTLSGSFSLVAGLGTPCVNAATTSIQINAIGGVAPYSFELYVTTSPTPVATTGSTFSTSVTFDGPSVPILDGTYYAVITDSASQTYTVSPIVIEGAFCSISIITQNPSCNGSADGLVSLSIIDPFDLDCACGLGGSFHTVWYLNGIVQPAYADQFSVYGLTAGTYTIEVTTCLGCTQTYNAVLENPSAITIDSELVQSTTCGSSNGILTVTAFGTGGGCIPDITWYSGNSVTFSGVNNTLLIPDGTHLSIFPGGGYVSGNLAVGQLINLFGVNPPQYNSPTTSPNFAITSLIPSGFQIACTETAAIIDPGYLSTNFVSGVEYINTINDDGSITSILSNVPAGDYDYVLTDGCACSYTSTLTVAPSAPPTVDIDLADPYYLCVTDGQTTCVTVDTDITTDCTLSSSSDLSIFVNGSSVPFTLNGNTATFTACDSFTLGAVTLGKGNNTITVQYVDCNGCLVQDTGNIVVTSPTDPVVGIAIDTPGNLTLCPGTTVPYVLKVLGGIGNGDWFVNNNLINPGLLWSFPYLTVDNTFFSGPVYTSTNTIILKYVEIDPINGCTSEFYIKIDPPTPVTLSISVTNIPCGGALNSGAVDLTVLNGCAPYGYSWTGPGGFTAFTQDITNLVAGTYQVTVLDSAGNSVSSGPIVVSVLVPDFDNVVVVPVCNNSSNGSISFDIIDATAPYSITWSTTNGSIPPPPYVTSNPAITLTGLKIGNYTILIEDDNGCTATETFIVENAPPIVITPTVWNTSCSSVCDGKIELDITGGAGAPYSVQWLHGPTTPIISNLCPGLYIADVVDSNGCTGNIKINTTASTQPPLDFTEIIINPNFETGTLGSIQISSVTNGGGPPYSYVWTDPDGNVLGTNSSLTGLSDGTYTVTVTGYPGCYTSRTYTLQGRCNAFSYPEYRLQLYKFQCCAGALAKKYVNLKEVGRMDLAKCLEADLKYMTVALDTLTCISQFPDPCLTCSDLNTIFNQLKKICDCDCCHTDADAYTVRYDYETQTFIPILPAASGGGTPPPPGP